MASKDVRLLLNTWRHQKPPHPPVHIAQKINDDMRNRIAILLRCQNGQWDELRVRWTSSCTLPDRKWTLYARGRSQISRRKMAAATSLTSCGFCSLCSPLQAVCAEKGFRLKVEAIADEQNNSKKIKEDGDVGQWKYPPHPNYFGELLLLWYALINTHSLLSLGFDKLVNVMAFYGLKHAEVMSLDPREVVVPVVGGHAGVTILPLLSQVKAGAGSATLSMAYAAVKFADACLKGLRGDANIVECAFVASHVTELPFFASKVRLGRCGVDEVYGLGPLNEYGGWDWRRQRKSLKGVLRITFVKK
uniref:Lactate/malate dehydrogenase C-terminal domain-containing protein n=1 Tax=Brassica oleracea var. oleracea TaxID=109376 RepID=A0A0D3B7R4_BRAOL